MIHEKNIRVLPKVAANAGLIKQHLVKEFSLNEKNITSIQVLKRSIDARQRQLLVNLRVRIFENELAEEIDFSKIAAYKQVGTAKPVVIVGAGPAGLFAALRLIELGRKPIILERGKAVNERRKDIAKITIDQKVNAESNYSFGEGGAGAFSDGKLFTRSKKKGNVARILQLFCMHGADPSILVDVHPHIGTDKLPLVIKKMRECILSCGGEVRFETRVDELIIKEDEVLGVVTQAGESISGPVILATGHSARDVYRFLDQQGVEMEAKSLALGVRLEHPQELIDQLQYHQEEGRGAHLPAAEYSFVKQVNGRGVYSFCMCPGGFVVPAASGPEQVVVNGMSPSNRGSKWANSGMVVETHPEDLPEVFKKEKLFAMLHFQEEMERIAYVNGGHRQVAPAQRMTDFVKKRLSYDLPESSYTPGVLSSPLHFWLPENIDTRLREGFKTFGNQSRGFLTEEALLIGVESRTSSPIRILRDKEELHHVRLSGLYPCGEGAGYAGGIVSAAIDGERCAEKVAQL